MTVPDLPPPKFEKLCMGSPPLGYWKSWNVDYATVDYATVDYATVDYATILETSNISPKYKLSVFYLEI